MNSIEWAGIDWLGRGWLLILAFSAAVLIVAALRKPYRRLFGSERAFQLWLLPPLALLASQLPHAAQALNLPPVVLAIASVPATLPAHVPASGAIDWSMALLWLWLAGSATVILLSIGAQRRYRRQLRGAMPGRGWHRAGRYCVRSVPTWGLRWLARGAAGSWCPPISSVATTPPNRR